MVLSDKASGHLCFRAPPVTACFSLLIFFVPPEEHIMLANDATIRKGCFTNNFTPCTIATRKTSPAPNTHSP